MSQDGTPPPTNGHPTPPDDAPPESAILRDLGDMLSASAAPKPPFTAPDGYELLDELGRGGMGVVYKAWRVALARNVALKVLSDENFTPTELTRFGLEAKAVAAVGHPNVIAVYETGVHAGRPFIALEYAPKGSLDDLLRNGPIPAANAAAIIARVARGVHAAHECGIVHRDLKPANILFGHGGTPKVADFGLAKRVAGGDGPTHPGTVMGTPSYMAPEQAAGAGDGIGPATDVHAVGAVLYHALTGRPPFLGNSFLETTLQVLHTDPAAPRMLVVTVPHDLETICLKCLRKVPAERYPSAAAVADDLERFLEGRPITARRVRGVERAWLWCLRNKLFAASLTAFASVAVAWAATATVDVIRAAHHRETSRHNAALALERGRSYCHAGSPERGLLWLARGLRLAVAGQAHADEQSIRAEIGLWVSYPPLRPPPGSPALRPGGEAGRPVAGDAATVELWMQLLTAAESTADAGIRALTDSQWRDCQRSLAARPAPDDRCLADLERDEWHWARQAATIAEAAGELHVALAHWERLVWDEPNWYHRHRRAGCRTRVGNFAGAADDYLAARAEYGDRYWSDHRGSPFLPLQTVLNRTLPVERYQADLRTICAATDPELDVLVGMLSVEPDGLNHVGWQINRVPGRPAAAYRVALRLAREALAASPGKSDYINSLGVAQYRAGQYQAALLTLNHSLYRNRNELGADPTDTAFLAMTHLRLGQHDEANDLLAKTRTLLDDPRRPKDEDAEAFFREAHREIESN